MPFYSIKYTIYIPTGLVFDSLTFGNNESLEKEDLVLKDGETNIYEDTLDDQLIETDSLNVKVDVSGTNGLEWELNLEIDEDPLPDNPINETASGGRADHDEDHDLP